MSAVDRQLASEKLRCDAAIEQARTKLEHEKLSLYREGNWEGTGGIVGFVCDQQLVL